MGGIRQPTLRTRRLVLRGFRMTDVEAVRTLAGDAAVARNTLNVPHPYTRQDAERWIASHPDQLRAGEAVTFAVTAPEEGRVVGAVGLILAPAHDRAELGYWIGAPYWGRGYATEASRAVVRWGFEGLGLRRIHASHFPRNPASGRVLEKLGMRHEGTLRQHVKKWDEYLDLESWGLLADEMHTGKDGT
jgi:ribosomal-protein-alanine N-acetyltransferase